MTNTEQEGRPRGRKERAAWYAMALEGQAGSGLNMAAYAARIGVAAATLYQWKKRLCGLSSSRVEANAVQPNGLIRVAIKNSPSVGTTEKFLVRLSHGRSLEVPQDFNSVALEQLLGILETC
jgi:transposase-like protein